MSKKTVVFDFDGVIHNYTGEWDGVDVISGSLVPGIDCALKAIHDAGYEVVVVSTRCAVLEGLDALKAWFRKHGIYGYIDRVSPTKPPAIVYIDDRAIRFDGNADGLLEQINDFHPWWEGQSK